MVLQLVAAEQDQVVAVLQVKVVTQHSLVKLLSVVVMAAVLMAVKVHQVVVLAAVVHTATAVALEQQDKDTLVVAVLTKAEVAVVVPVAQVLEVPLHHQAVQLVQLV